MKCELRMKYFDSLKRKYQSKKLFKSNDLFNSSIQKTINDLLTENVNIPMLKSLIKSKNYSTLKKLSPEFSKIFERYSKNKVEYCLSMKQYLAEINSQLLIEKSNTINESKVINNAIKKFDKINSTIPTYKTLLDNMIEETIGYTGSPNDFDEFSVDAIKRQTQHGYGFYITKNKDIAVYYARKFGVVYTVEIPDDEYFLNENAELINQDKEIQEKLSNIYVKLFKKKKYGDYIADNWSDDDTGKEIYNNIQDTLQSPEKASALLLKHGIKGIKFDDAQLGICYVVFSPKDIKILKKERQNKKQTNEAYSNISNELYATKSAFDVVKSLRGLNQNKPYVRLLYDKSVKLWLADFGDTLIHFDMLRAAYKAGFYPQFRNQYDFENYINEDEWLDEPNMFRFKAHYNSENIKEIIEQEKADGYTTAYQYDTFTIVDRGGVDLPETPLWNKLGQPNETISLYEAIETVQKTATNLNDNFWKWFGNSKIVDENGNPLICYHGTSSEFKAFNKKKIGQRDNGFYGKGFYFSPVQHTAKYYSQNGQIMAVYLSIQNPLDLSEYVDQKIEDISTEKLKELGIYDKKITDKNGIMSFENYINYFNLGDKLTKQAIQNGYDGISVKHKIHEIIAFYPNQIKSVDNNGDWSSISDNIYETEDTKTTTPKPITLIGYHGTTKDFDNFDTKYSEDGIYFAPKKRLYSLAAKYAKENGYIIKAKITLNKPFIGSPREFGELYNKHYNEMKEKYDGVISISDGGFPYKSSYFNYKTNKIEIENPNKGDIVEILVFNPDQIKILSKERLSRKQLDELCNADINESTFYGKVNWQNNMDALGNVPATIGHNLFATMYPQQFLNLCPPYSYGDDNWFDKQLDKRVPYGIPFLKVDVDTEHKQLIVTNHEGRHRVASVARRNQNVDIPVAILYNKDKYTLPDIHTLRKEWSIISQNGNRKYNVGEFSLYTEFPKASKWQLYDIYKYKPPVTETKINILPKNKNYKKL